MLELRILSTQFFSEFIEYLIRWLGETAQKAGQLFQEPLFYLLLSALPLLYFGALFLRSISQPYPWLRFWRLKPSDSLQLRTWLEMGGSMDGGTYQQLFGLWWRKNKNKLLSYWSLIWVLPFSIILTYSVSKFLTSIGWETSDGFVSTAWQAQLTITGLTFIVLVFLLDQIYQSEYGSRVVRNFLSKLRVMPVLYFTLYASIMLSWAHFFASEPFASNMALFLFVGTVTSISYVYYKVAKLISIDPIDKIAVQEIKHNLDRLYYERQRETASRSVFENSLADILVRAGTNKKTIRTAQDMGVQGQVVDINMRKLEDSLSQIKSSLDEPYQERLGVNLQLNRKLKPETPVLTLNTRDYVSFEIPEEADKKLSESVYTKKPQPTAEEIIEQNIDVLGDVSKSAIEYSQPYRVDQTLQSYMEVLNYASEYYPGSTTGIVIRNFPYVIKKITREFRSIFAESVRANRPEIAGKLRAKTRELALVHHRRENTQRFNDVIGLYTSYYSRLSSSKRLEVDTQIHTLFVSMDNLFTTLSSDLSTANSLEEIKGIKERMGGWHDTIEDILRYAIEEGSGKDFSRARKVGNQDFAFIRPGSLESDITILEMDINGTESQSKREKLEEEKEYKKAQKEAIEELKSKYKQTVFIASAYAYRDFIKEELSEKEFAEFSVFERYSSVKQTSQVYFDLITSGRIHSLMKWQSDEEEVFEGAKVSSSDEGGWLREFYTVACVLTIDEDEYGKDMSGSDNPLSEIDISPSQYTVPEIDIEGLRENISKLDVEIGDIEEKIDFFERMHRAYQESIELEEELKLIGADLDEDRVSEFKHEYLNSFRENFVLRDIFDELNWLGTKNLDSREDVDALGYSVYYPKQGFVPREGVAHMHGSDRKAEQDTRSLTEELLGKMREFLDAKSVESYEEIPERLINLVGGFEGAIIVFGDRRARRAVMRHEKFETDNPRVDTVGHLVTDSGNRIPAYSDRVSSYDIIIFVEDEEKQILSEYLVDGELVDIDIEKVTPTLIEEHSEEDLEEMEVDEVDNLLKKVLLRIYYRHELEPEEGLGFELEVDR